MDYTTDCCTSDVVSPRGIICRLNIITGQCVHLTPVQTAILTFKSLAWNFSLNEPCSGLSHSGSSNTGWKEAGSFLPVGTSDCIAAQSALSSLENAPLTTKSCLLEFNGQRTELLVWSLQTKRTIMRVYTCSYNTSARKDAQCVHSVVIFIGMTATACVSGCVCGLHRLDDCITNPFVSPALLTGGGSSGQ